MSATSICRSALNLLGDYPLNSLEEDTKQARLCRQEYEGVRDATFAAHPWRCLKKRDELAATTEKPPFGWGYAYNLPVDCAYVVPPSVEGIYDSDPIEYEVQGRQLLCDLAGPLPVIYVRRSENTADYDPMLRQAIAAHLAMWLSFPITGIARKFEEMSSLYTFTLNEAKRIDSKGGTPLPAAAPGWERARY